MPKLNGLKDPNDNPLPLPATTDESSLITSLLGLGTIFGSILSGFPSERIGRKKTLLVFAIPMFTAHVMLIFANSLVIIYTARFFCGLGAGCVFAVVPNYITEISEDKNRGIMGCTMGIALATGTMSNYIIGPFVSMSILSCFHLVPIVLFIVLFGWFVPETPYYFASYNDKNNLETCLMKFRNQSSTDVQKELVYIIQTVEDSQAAQGSLKDLFKLRYLRRGLIISCMLMVVQQFSGITAVLGYMQTIFEATGSSISPEYSSMFVGITQVIVQLFVCNLIEKLGRRILLMFSTVGSFISLVTLGVYFYLNNNGYDTSSIFWLPIASLMIYIVAYNAGLASLPWTIMGELFPSNVKSLASTFTSCVCLTISFIIAQIFSSIVVVFGMAGTFWMFSGFCIAGFFFTMFVVPETKGKSSQEIQAILEGHNKKQSILQ